MKMLRNTLVMMTGLCLSLTSCQNKQMNEELAKYKALESKEASNIEIVRQFYTHLDKFMDDDLTMFAQLGRELK